MDDGLMNAAVYEWENCFINIAKDEPAKTYIGLVNKHKGDLNAAALELYEIVPKIISLYTFVYSVKQLIQGMLALNDLKYSTLPNFILSADCTRVEVQRTCEEPISYHYVALFLNDIFTNQSRIVPLSYYSYKKPTLKYDGKDKEN